jgi:hypothetical protein
VEEEVIDAEEEEEHREREEEVKPPVTVFSFISTQFPPLVKIFMSQTQLPEQLHILMVSSSQRQNGNCFNPF